MEKMTDELCKVHAKLPEPPPEIEATLAVLSGKWKILILWQLMRRVPAIATGLRRAGFSGGWL